MIYYNRYIGSITVQEFIRPYTSQYMTISDAVTCAIQDAIYGWVWDEDVPKNFHEVILSYCKTQLPKSAF